MIVNCVNKVMATVYWDKEGVVLVDFLEGQKTVTESYCVEVSKQIKDRIS